MPQPPAPPSNPTGAAHTPAAQTYRLYAANGRVYASNIRQKLIDLGSLAERGGGFVYALDGNHRASEGFASAPQALAHLAGQLSFLYLDGQFTALADVRGPVGPNLDGAVELDITLDELDESDAAAGAAA